MTYRPSLLIVEDDPISGSFFCDALAPLAELQLFDTLTAALAATSSSLFAAAIVDCQLADGPALPRLADLRHRLPATSPIFMTSAEWDGGKRSAHVAAGATACWSKPISVTELRAELTSLSAVSSEVWDDAAASARLGGNPAQLFALREMLLAELPTQLQRAEIAWLNKDTARVREELHRLRAACGFCGAERLAAAIAAWSGQPSDLQMSVLLVEGRRLLESTTDRD